MSLENVGVVRSMYAGFAKGDIPAIIGVLGPQVEWSAAHPPAKP